jgi:ribosomal-protein-alanine N-acetyltransferase
MDIKFEIIETERLILKGISNQLMFNIFETFPKEQIKLILGHETDEAFEKELYKHKNGYSSYKSAFVMFLLEDKASKQIIGRCALHNWNAECYRAEIGYHIEKEENKQKGYMSEAAKAIIHFGFNRLNLNRIEALVSPKNMPSLKIIQKLNFIQEGILKQHFFVDGQFVDSLIFGLLKSASIQDSI